MAGNSVHPQTKGGCLLILLLIAVSPCHVFMVQGGQSFVLALLISIIIPYHSICFSPLQTRHYVNRAQKLTDVFLLGIYTVFEIAICLASSAVDSPGERPYCLSDSTIGVRNSPEELSSFPEPNRTGERKPPTNHFCSFGSFISVSRSINFRWLPASHDFTHILNFSSL